MGIFNNKEIKIFITFFLIYSMFAFHQGWLENTKVDLTMAIVDEGRLEIDTFANNTGDRAFYNGHYYSDTVPGVSILAIPSYLASKFILGEVSIPQDMFFNDGYSKDFLILLFLITIFTSSLFSALTVVLVYKISRFFTKESFYRFLVVIIFGLGTITLHSARQFLEHGASTFFIFLSFYLIFKMKKEKKDYSFLAGLSAGFAVFTELLTSLAIPGFLILIFSLKKRKQAMKFILGTLIFISIFFLYNYSIFGHPLKGAVYYYEDPIRYEKTPYNFCKGLEGGAYDDCIITYDALENNNLDLCEKIKRRDNLLYCRVAITLDSKYCSMIQGKTAKANCYLKIMTGTYYRYFIEFLRFNQRKINTLIRLFFYPYAGMFFYSPILLLSLIGLWPMFKRYKIEAGMVVYLVLILAIHIASRQEWFIESTVGIRQFTFLMPFLMIPLLISFKKVNKKIIIALTIISILINIVAIGNTSTINTNGPEEGYLYSIGEEYYSKLDSWKVLKNPLLERYLPSFIRFGPQSLLIEKIVQKPIPPFLNVFVLLGIIALIWKKELYKYLQKVKII